MSNHRELLIGLLTALVSVLIIGGGLALSLTEDSVPIAIVPSETPIVILPTSGNPTSTSLSSGNSTRPPNLPTDTPIPTSAHTSTPSFTALPVSCSFPSGWSMIIIEPGDTLESIAQRYNTTVQELAEGNCLVTNTILPGSTLYVPGLSPTETILSCGPPPGWLFYTVQDGDSLFNLSLRYGVSVEELQMANCMGDSTIVRIGQKIYVPNTPTITTESTSTPIEKPKPSGTPTPTSQASPTLTPSITLSPTFIPRDTSTAVPSPTASSTTQALPTLTPTLTQTPQPTRTQTPTRTSTPTDTPTITPTRTPLPSQTPTVTPSPSFTPTETIIVITIKP